MKLVSLETTPWHLIIISVKVTSLQTCVIGENTSLAQYCSEFLYGETSSKSRQISVKQQQHGNGAYILVRWR
jgi:hypothetical protein